MDHVNKDDLKEFLITLFGNKARRWEMNDKIFNLTFELVAASQSCSDAIDLVPRPMPLGSAPIKWLTKEARGIFLRKLKDKKENYAMCLKAAAYTMSFKFDMAAQGI